MIKNEQNVIGKMNIYIPFITSTPIYDLIIVMLLWPFFWLIGVEQLITPFVAMWLLFKTLAINKGKLKYNSTIVLSFLLAVWFLVPLAWVDSDELDLFFKEYSTLMSQVIILIVILVGVKNKFEWNRLIHALEVITIICCFSGLLYVSGLFTTPINSLISNILPSSLLNESNFFSNIAFRELGREENWVLFGRRAASFSYSPSAFSSFLLFTFPFIWWNWQRSTGRIKKVRLILLSLIVLNIFLTWTRTSIIILIIEVFLLVFLSHKQNFLRPFIILGFLLIIILLLFGLLILGNDTYIDYFSRFFIDFRSGSWKVRFDIYKISLDMLSDHIIAGWGVAKPIPGLSSNFSAGTHSGYLAMLFQHGIVGLFLYGCLLFSIFRAIASGYKMSRKGLNNGFWIAAITFMIALLLRDFVSIWWWDQLVSMTIWIIWGVILTAPRVIHNHNNLGNKFSQI